MHSQHDIQARQETCCADDCMHGYCNHHASMAREGDSWHRAQGGDRKQTSPASVRTHECMPPAATCCIRSSGTQGVGSTTSLGVPAPPSQAFESSQCEHVPGCACPRLMTQQHGVQKHMLSP